MESAGPALAVFASLPALRKVLVISTFVDVPLSRKKRSERIAREAARFAQVAVGIGRYAHWVARGAIREGMDPAAVFQFETVQQAAAFLRGFLREGDLVLVKGEGHLARIFLSFERPVACWTEKCTRAWLCDVCPELLRPTRPEDLPCAE